MNKAALVVMARAPQAGRVKTRLQPALTPYECAGLYAAFLGDTIDLAISIEEFIPFLAYMPVESKLVFERLIPAGMQIMPQVGGDLGQVMDMLMRRLMAQKYTPVIIIGSDIPALQPGTLRRALTALAHADVCLGPASDGGYYLVGARRPVPALFQNIPWSTPDVLKATQESARRAGLSTTLLEELSDVDTKEALSLLEEKIRKLRSEPGARIPLRTEAWLKAGAVNARYNGR
jgi:rSAM/selenodomain-associated transferase 1